MHSLSFLPLVALIGFASASPNFRSGRQFDCQNEGRFADVKDCTSYFTCTRKVNGDLSSSRATCGTGHAFSTSASACVPQSQVPDCPVSSRTAREENHRAEEYDHLCASGDGFRCGDCKHFIDCSDGKAYMQESCDTDYTCQMHHTHFPNGVCYNRDDDTEKCKCDTPDAHQQHPDPFNTPHGFFDCHAADTDPEVHHCKGDIEYDTVTKSCKDDYPDCHEQGEFPVHGQCTHYYRCTMTSAGWAKVKKTCSTPGHQYNQYTHVCSDPCTWNWEHNDFTCTDEGMFPHPRICQDYFVCVEKPDGTYKSSHLSCPKHHHFEPSVTNNVHSGQCVPEAEYLCVPPASHASEIHHCVKPTNCP